MAKIVLIGWYGTETIGDRAILAGLLNLFSEAFGTFEIKIGSFFKVFTERTLLEDLEFYAKISERNLNSISIFDSSKLSDLNEQIDWADIVAVGGGPLAEIDQMYMLEYAFGRARKRHKKTALLGCGVGPLISKQMISSFYNIVRNADIKIFRDKNLSLMKENCSIEYCTSCDPATFAASYFINEHNTFQRKDDFISINFREITSGVVEKIGKDEKKIFLSLIRNLVQKTTCDILLVPMHTFYIGGDDRYTLNWIAGQLRSERVFVQNRPLSLEETMKVYFDSICALGMRFHSVLLQTLLNGKNYILDYTFPTTGKTVNFLRQFNLLNEYEGRYMSLITDSEPCFEINPDCIRISVSDQMLLKMRLTYIECLKS